MQIIKPHTVLEEKLWKKGFINVVGIDEAGKGPWAGPVTAGAVLIHSKKQVVKTVRDSKLMTKLQREKAFEKIIKKSSGFGIGIVSEQEIDKIGIQKAVKKAMLIALKNLKLKFKIKISYLLVDGSKTIPLRKKNAKRILRGGLYHYSISAASVLAKVTRDELMKKMSKQYPNYGFERHVGYGTKLHMEKLKTHGFSPIHRKSFAPIKNMLNV
ncbi:MAG: ribonuclease HII [Candidatus Levybacteria bacterium]|nr:ribonuclease HII [Candidatus Levybacteria bacterium]